MYRFVHVIPVGTSLLGNFQRDFPKRVSGWGFSNWDRWAPDDRRQDLLCSRYKEVFVELSSYLSSRGFEASAELSPLRRAFDLFGHPPDKTLIMLYSTETCNSRLAMETIAGFLRDRGYHVNEASIRGVRSSDDFEEGLVEVLDKVVRLIMDWRARGARVFVNATPGYKAESSFLVLASLLAGADVIYYMHESFRDIVILPSIPIEIRREYVELIKRFSEPREQREAEEIAGTPDRLRELVLRGIVKSDGYKYITRRWARKLLESIGGI